MVSKELQALLTVIDQAFDKKSWHGTNLRGSLRGVAYPEASEDIGIADYHDAFRDSIRATHFFSQVDFDWALEEEPDVFIRPLHPCNLGEGVGGGFVPIFPILTLGIVPQVVRGSSSTAPERSRWVGSRLS